MSGVRSGVLGVAWDAVWLAGRVRARSEQGGGSRWPEPNESGHVLGRRDRTDDPS